MASQVSSLAQVSGLVLLPAIGMAYDRFDSTGHGRIYGASAGCVVRKQSQHWHGMALLRLPGFAACHASTASRLLPSLMGRREAVTCLAWRLSTAHHNNRSRLWPGSSWQLCSLHCIGHLPTVIHDTAVRWFGTVAPARSRERDGPSVPRPCRSSRCHGWCCRGSGQGWRRCRRPTWRLSRSVTQHSWGARREGDLIAHPMSSRRSHSARRCSSAARGPVYRCWSRCVNSNRR